MVKRLEAIPAYPLQWPAGWKRTAPHKQRRSRYETDFGAARDDAMNQVRLLGARDAVLSTNVPTRRDGLPYANYSEPEDSGVALYWTMRKADGSYEQRVIACDTWRTVRENMRAVGLTLGALRQLDRTGASEIMDRAYQGFAALPGAVAERSWRDVLGFTKHGPVSSADVEVAYRMLARQHHPDRGGDPTTMVELNGARDRALEALRHA